MYYTEQTIFPSVDRSNYRIPSVVTTKRGTVLAFCNDRIDTRIDHADEAHLCVRRKAAGGEWEPEKRLFAQPGWSCYIGAAVYDAETDTVMCFFTRNAVVMIEFHAYSKEELDEIARLRRERSEAAGIADGTFLMCSDDDGVTWYERPLTVNAQTALQTDGKTVYDTGFTHGSAAGIQLKYGKYRGRLLCPARVASGRYSDAEGLCKHSYNNALFSDDHGMTWSSSAPVQHGTGEGTLAECGDGRILYNSRAYYRDAKRYLADSRDGGEHWDNFRIDDFLIEQKNLGCNASLLRVERNVLGEDAALLPDNADAVTIFINPRSENRENVSACVSFDDGSTWSTVKPIHPGLSGYSSLAYSETEHRFFLLYELGNEDPCDIGLNIAEFDLAWLLSK
ncbi:MAG: exo-alpha-sialidase [Clostridia bacterium]|nr:exo-alpha-sialidase [Clostridia bacterium]